MINYKNNEKDISKKVLSFTNLYHFETFHGRYLRYCMFLTFSWRSLIEGKCSQSIFGPYQNVFIKNKLFYESFVKDNTTTINQNKNKFSLP